LRDLDITDSVIGVLLVKRDSGADIVWLYANTVEITRIGLGYEVRYIIIIVKRG
jgi:hypothetical protein